jgi:glycosyltransferase 2 family protein
MNKKQIIFTLAKIAFATIVLTLLFHKVDAGDVWEKVHHAEHTPILAGVLLCWLTILIAGWRWHSLLAVFEIEIPIVALICIAQIGQFFLMFLPGPAGDDLTRMLYISRLSKGRVGEACTTVLLDRCIGLASILLLAVACIPWQWHLLASSGKTYWLAVGISAAGIAVFIAGVLFFLVDGLFMQRVVEKILRHLPPSKIREEFSVISKRIFTSKIVIAKVMGAAIGTQFLLCSVFYLAGRSVGIHGPIAIWLGFVPIVLAANAVPITIAGFGVREFLMALFLGVLAHVEKEQALAASFIAFSMTLVVCLLGGIVYIFYKPAKKENTSPGIENPAAPH